LTSTTGELKVHDSVQDGEIGLVLANPNSLPIFVAASWKWFSSSVARLSAEHVVDKKGRKPNEQLTQNNERPQVNYEAAHQYIVDRLRRELSNDLTYHGIHHTIDVIESIETISVKEGLNEAEICIAKTAALFHDIGFLFQYEDNEMLAIDQVKETLPGFNYSATEIDTISGMIEATIIHVKPRNHLERIMIDADFDYFGRNDFEQISANLLDELNTYGMNYSPKQWDEVQVRFLQAHQYYTNYSIKNRLGIKKKNLSIIVERLSKY
jgi:predicted metal-dependent HD superfamily phosphohydrolase